MTLAMEKTLDPAATSWVDGADTHPDFPVQNLPLGIFRPDPASPFRGGMAIGAFILDLPALASLLEGSALQAARLTDAPTLNPLFASGNARAGALRLAVFEILTDETRAKAVWPFLYPATDCELSVPFAIGDYTDFYTGIAHAENVGRLFRPDNPLLPNYKHVPIGYHGRSSSIRPSGVDVVRPYGQCKPASGNEPLFSASRRLDYELEMAIWIGHGNRLGEPIAIEAAGGHIAGLSILNDWSARDVQAWEYQPLGPFLAKNFHSTISPWVVTSAALIPFRTSQPPRPDGDPTPLPYLYDQRDQALGAYAVTMEVHITTELMRAQGLAAQRLSRGQMTAMYWTAAQLVAHHTAGGCNLQAGDLFGTGTLSGYDPDSFGSLLEITAGGARPLILPGGETRTFLEAGDEVVMTAFAEAPGHRRIGFGECRAQIMS